MRATSVVELRRSKGVEKETRPTTQSLLVSEQKPTVHLLLLESFLKKKKIKIISLLGLFYMFQVV